MAMTVIGVFDSATEAQQAVDQLVSAGFSRSNIDLSAHTGGYTSDSGSTTSGSAVPDRHQNTSGTYAEEVVDDTKDVGSSIGNFFSSLFGDDDEDTRTRYTRAGSRGSIVTVHASSSDEAEQAADILDDNGAIDVNERESASTYGTGTSTYGTTTAATGVTGTTGYTDTDLTNVNTGDTLKVIQENLEVGKREVQTGGVRVRSRIVERPVEESLRLREERVSIQRTPVNRPATAADLNAFQEASIEVTESAEVPVVSKTANVVEEISLGKEVNERVETVRDTVRSTDVEVENLGTTGTTTTGTGLTGTGLTDTDDTTYSTNK